MCGLKAALFDLYDTLTYVDRLLYQEKIDKCATVCRVAPAKFSKAWRSLYLQSTLGHYPRTEDRVKAVLDILEVPSSEEVIRDVTEHEHNFLRTGMILFEDAISTISSLKKAGLKLGLVTNASPSVRVIVNNYKFDEYFDAVIVSSEVNSRKPSEGIYKVTLEKLGVKSTETIFVGDGNDDELAGARNLGITTVWVDRGLPKYQKDEHPGTGYDFRAESLEEVGKIILAMVDAPTGT